MSAILITITAAYAHDDGDRMTVEIEEFAGRGRGRKRQMVIDLPIYEDELIAGLCAGWDATTGLLQHSVHIKSTPEGPRKLLTVL